MYFTLNNMTNSGARCRGQITSVVPESTYYARQNAFQTEAALAHIPQANGPPNLYAFRASNAHPVPTRPLVIALQCAQTEFISAEQLPLNVAHILRREQFCGPLAWQQLMSAFPECTCHARQNAFRTEAALAHILQANTPPKLHAFRASNAHPVLSLYISLVPWSWRCDELRRN